MKKKITYEEYEKELNKVAEENKEQPVEETLIKMIEKAAEFSIEENPKT